MEEKRNYLTPVLIVVLILVTALGIVQNMSEPLDGTLPVPMAAVLPYGGNAADGITSTGNSQLIGGKDSGGLARSLRTDTSGRAEITSTGALPVSLAAGDPLPITGTIGEIIGVVDVDATGQGTLPISGTIGSVIGVVDVDATGQGTLPISGTIGAIIGVVDVDATGQGDLPMVPFAAITELAVTEIIGENEQAAQYDWSDGTQLALGGTYSGEILNITLILSGTLSEAGTLVVFDADPNVNLAAANLATASWLLAIGKVDIAAGDWYEEDSGGTGAVATFAEPIAFHALSSLWVAYYHEGATQWNSLAADNETLDIQIEYRRDS